MRRLIIVLLGFQILFISCGFFTSDQEHVKELVDLDHLKERGRIIAVTDYNTADYSIYRGTPMGYQFELLADFADYVGLQLEIIVESDPEKRFELLNNNECDIIATNIAVISDQRQEVTLTTPHSHARQILVQRKSNREPYGYTVSKVTELAGKTVYVQKNSPYALRLRNLAAEIGDTIVIKEVGENEETLLKWVSTGKIDYTVCFENIALINRTVYKNIDFSMPVGFDQHLAWAVRKESVQLLDYVNNWMEAFKRTTKYHVLYRRYFVNGDAGNIAHSDFFTIHTGKMSAYDNAIKKYSKDLGWDWKLLASLIYQESRFKTDARSWAGAFGIMQLMPATAEIYGVDTASCPIDQIRAGVKYLKWLDKIFDKEIQDKDEKIKFILAAYNVGFGHVQDARRLAVKYGADPNVWDNNVDYYVLNKSKPEYYKDEVVKHGYARGSETYKYVKEILERYRHYTNLIVEN